MVSIKDARDILSLDGQVGGPSTSDQPLSIESIITPDYKKKANKKTPQVGFKRPDGMHRELYALLYSDNKDVPPLIPTGFPNKLGGYRHVKASLGLRKPSKWVWSAFLNPARSAASLVPKFFSSKHLCERISTAGSMDRLELSHWMKAGDEAKEYPFAKFNKVLDCPSYTAEEYERALKSDTWSKEETDHLVDLCARFDLRWPVISDRYEHERFKKRSIEDMKERYYDICNEMAKMKCPVGEEPPVLYFDAEHERRRKEQLEKLYNRTEEQIEEEEFLNAELKKIEARRKERERKAQDLQKLITAADIGPEHGFMAPKASGIHLSASGAQLSALPSASGGETKKRKLATSKTLRAAADGGGEPSISSGSIKWPESKGPGVSLRSLRLKLPGSLGQKKVKALEALLDELGLELNPIATEEICEHFNLLRSDLVLLYELRAALANCQFDLESLRHQYNALTGRELPIPSRLRAPVAEDVTDSESNAGDSVANVCSLKRRLDEILEIGLPPRRRRNAVPPVSTPADSQRKLRSS